jgi:aspartyl/asparaginyl beta-hydroxylase (cupin superfamily)
MEKSLFQLLDIFNRVQNVFMQYFVRLSAEKVFDRNKQSNIFLIVTTKLANMRKAVHQVTKNFYPKMLKRSASLFNNAGMREEAKPLLKSLVQINDICRNIYQNK